MNKVVPLLLIFSLIAACALRVNRKIIHMDFPDKSPTELAREAELAELQASGAGLDNSEEDDDTPPEEESITQMEVIDAEIDDDEIYQFDPNAPIAPDPINFGGNGNITLRRNGTNEVITVKYRNEDGSYSKEAMDKIQYIMRCFDDDTEHEVAIKLIELLDAVEDHFGKRGLIILSGYRTPEYNRQVKGSARNSMHILGWAADIRIPGYKPSAISAFVRKKRAGGVGYYPYTGFVHIDVGGVRYWQQTRTKRKKASASRKAKSQHNSSNRGKNSQKKRK